jgi:hypothetical protein
MNLSAPRARAERIPVLAARRPTFAMEASQVTEGGMWRVSRRGDGLSGKGVGA